MLLIGWLSPCLRDKVEGGRRGGGRGVPRIESFWFSCEIAHYEKSLISVFQELFFSFNNFYILAMGLGAGLSLSGVLRFYWYLLIS